MNLCDICEEENESLTLFAKHMFFHMNEIPFFCFSCFQCILPRIKGCYSVNNVTFVSGYFDSATSTIPENDSHLCGECLDWFPHFNDILLHKNEHKEKYVHRCTECPFVFSSRAQLYQHHHETLPYHYECNGCGIKFKEKSSDSTYKPLIISNLEKTVHFITNSSAKELMSNNFRIFFTIIRYPFVVESCTTKIPICVQSFGVENHEACDSNLVLKDSSIKSSIDICRIETTNAEIETDFVGFPVNSEKESIFRSCNSDSLNKVSEQDSPLEDLN
ncbi:hypothetical protein CDAR_26761, partial [Caerostris darwini]